MSEPQGHFDTHIDYTVHLEHKIVFTFVAHLLSGYNLDYYYYILN